MVALATAMATAANSKTIACSGGFGFRFRVLDLVSYGCFFSQIRGFDQSVHLRLTCSFCLIFVVVVGGGVQR